MTIEQTIPAATIPAVVEIEVPAVEVPQETVQEATQDALALIAVAEAISPPDHTAELKRIIDLLIGKVDLLESKVDSLNVTTAVIEAVQATEVIADDVSRETVEDLSDELEELTETEIPPETVEKPAPASEEPSEKKKLRRRGFF